MKICSILIDSKLLKKMTLLYLKKLVTRLPNFPDRRIRYEFF